MNKKILLTSFIALCGFSQNLQASVWQEENQWDYQWEEKYREFIASEAVHPTIFHDRNSPYYGIKVDCADTAYSLRAVFAFENKLPFRMKNPAYRAGSSRTPKYISNQLNNFDRVEAGAKRVVALMNYVGGVTGTEQLAASDSFPVAISEIKSGDIFMYKISSNGKYIRHTYVLKDITPVGNFDLIFSTQARKKDGRPLDYKKNQELSHAPDRANWGFKRFMWPEHYEGLDLKVEDGYSLEQYTMARELGEKGFFAKVKEILSSQEEELNQVFTRRLGDYCQKLKDRVEAVASGVSYSTRINRCMNYEEYDAYSTPNRDSHIRSELEAIEADYKKVLESGEVNQLDSEVAQILESLTGSERPSANQMSILNDYCKIEYSPGKILDIWTASKLVRERKMSFHPNDSLELRWGMGTDRSTRCTMFYQ